MVVVEIKKTSAGLQAGFRKVCLPNLTPIFIATFPAVLPLRIKCSNRNATSEGQRMSSDTSRMQDLLLEPQSDDGDAWK